MASEEARVAKEEQSTEVLTAFNRIPYALINAEVEGSTQDIREELTEICRYYKVYKKGEEFAVEGSHGDYVPAQLRYKMTASLIDKEARFLFAEPPDIVVEPKGDVGKTTDEAKDAITVLNDLLKTVFEKNMFEDALVKAAKDCFIGKRVAAVINFNEEDGVTITFLPSTQFIYETKMGVPSVITKFIAFIVVRESRDNKSKRIFKKKFEVGDDGVVYLEEALYDGAGALIEQLVEYQETLMPMIPAVVFVNDGLTGDSDGESEVDSLRDYEKWYSKLSNADIDANRKSMNPTKYTVDMESNSTKNLSSAAGSIWHMGTDQNLDEAHPMVGLLEPNMAYSASLKTTLDRINTIGHEQIDMPNITLESLQGAITSGKALKALYWPLIVRCKEKMKVWGPQLRKLADIIIQGALVYPDCVEAYTNNALVTPVAYEIRVDQNTPLPEDEAEEKTIDLSEVDSQVMSRKRYMQKWYNLTDDEVQAELEQIALERQIIEDAAFGTGEGGESEDEVPYPDTEDEGLEEDYEDDPTELDDDAEGVADDMELDDMLQGALDELSML